MGNQQAKVLVQPGYAYRVTSIAAESPGADANFITDVSAGTTLQHVKQRNQYRNIFDLINDNENQPIFITVFNLLTRKFRVISVVPNQNWQNADSLLGVMMRYQSYKAARQSTYRVIQVFPNSPAESAGLTADSDYVVAIEKAQYSDFDQFINLIVQSQYTETKSINLAIYSTQLNQVRLVNMVPNRKWGGKGCVGCQFGNGILNQVPYLDEDEDGQQQPDELEPDQDIMFTADTTNRSSQDDPNQNLLTKQTEGRQTDENSDPNTETGAGKELDSKQQLNKIVRNTPFGKFSPPPLPQGVSSESQGNIGIDSNPTSNALTQSLKKKKRNLQNIQQPIKNNSINQSLIYMQQSQQILDQRQEELQQLNGGSKKLQERIPMNRSVKNPFSSAFSTESYFDSVMKQPHTNQQANLKPENFEETKFKGKVRFSTQNEDSKSDPMENEIHSNQKEQVRHVSRSSSFGASLKEEEKSDPTMRQTSQAAVHSQNRKLSSNSDLKPDIINSYEGSKDASLTDDSFSESESVKSSGVNSNNGQQNQDVPFIVSNRPVKKTNQIQNSDGEILMIHQYSMPGTQFEQYIIRSDQLFDLNVSIQRKYVLIPI